MVAFREGLKKTGKEKEAIPGYNAILAYLGAKALKEFPFMNASWTNKGILLNDLINIGIAVDTEDGLRVVVLREADRKDLFELNSSLNTFAYKAIEEPH